VGIENIIKRISKEYYQNMPKGESWHKELLDLSYNPPQGKRPIFDKIIVDRLNPIEDLDIYLLVVTDLNYGWN
jgi:hypothetical protein